MLPGELRDGSFGKYPPMAAEVERASLPLLRRLPLPLLPILLREVSGYDCRFRGSARRCDG